ncbi:MAG TPA: invasin domain 3-containing protein, partial [Pseudonocardia sp.]|nr:invasin domain 3-containing protein [Pseudonocardia sp.]
MSSRRWPVAAALAVAAACGEDAAGPAPGPVSAEHSVVTVSRGVLVAGTLAEVTLETRDARSRRVTTGGYDVVFVATGGTSAGVMGPVTDQGDGTYRANFTGVTAGTPTTIGATVDGETVTQPLPTIEVVPGPISPIMSFVSVAPRTVVTGGQATFTLVTADAMGNELGAGGRVVQFGVAGGTSIGTIGPVTDHGTGRYTATFTATGVGTPLTVGATVDGVPVVPPLPTIAVAHGVSADSSTLSVSSDTVTVHGSVTLTLQVRDSVGVARRSGGEVVELVVLGGGGGSGTIDSTVDHDDGTYTASFTATAAGGPVEIGATLNGRAVGGPPPAVTILPIAIAAQNSTVAVSDDSVPAGGTATFTLEVRDVDSNRVTTGGLAVQFFLDDDGTSGGTIGSTTDHADGRYSATFTGTRAGTPATVGATINDSTRVQMLDTLGNSHLPTITVDPGPPAHDSSLVSASPAQVELGDSGLLLLETRDAWGNALRSGGRGVAFQRVGGFGASAGRIGAVTDHGDGRYSARYRADTAGRPDTIRALLDGAPVTSARPTITVVCTALAVSPAQSQVTVNDTTPSRAPVRHVTLPSGVSTTVTLWARDDRACPVTVPVLVALGTAGGTSGGVMGAVVDQGDGTYVASFTGGTAGTASAVVATVDGQPVTSPA